MEVNDMHEPTEQEIERLQMYCSNHERRINNYGKCETQCSYCEKQQAQRKEKQKEFAAKLTSAEAEEAFTTGNVKAFYKEDLINEPNHYHKGGIDIYELMDKKYDSEKFRGFCIGNILKYVLRYENKGGVESLKKARFNLDKLIDSYEGGQGSGEGETKQGNQEGHETEA